MSGWQPIATAPQNGTHILIFAEQAVSVGRWHRDWVYYAGGVPAEYDGETATAFRPTHWMPLPPAPDALKPCPFCGGEADGGPMSGQPWLLWCVSCGAEGPVVETLADEMPHAAIAAWNRRTP